MKLFLQILIIKPNVLLKLNKKLFQNVKLYKGIIGPIIQFSTIFDDKNFINNIMKLKGRYDLLLLLTNKNVNLNYNYIYEEYKYFSLNEFNELKKYFIDLSKKINDDFQYSICPTSLINSIKQETCFFPQNIYNKGTKDTNKSIFGDFNTLLIPNSKSLATYAKKNQKSISIFVEYDGISIIILLVEYFYNILRMLINIPFEEKIELANEIYNVLCLILKIFFKILLFFDLSYFLDIIDTFGFSIKKLLGLLFDIQPLHENLKDILIDSGNQLIIYSQKLCQNESQAIIINFLCKLISIIFSSKYIYISDYSNTVLFFEFINSVVNLNYDLINQKMIYELLSFSFILDPISFDKYYGNPPKTTLESNKEYKKMKKSYKNLIITFIKNSSRLNLYAYYLQEVFSNQYSSWKEKYVLMKLYYKYHNVQSLYNNQRNNDSSILNIFKREKNNKKEDISEKSLLQIYQNYFLNLIEISGTIDKYNETHFELTKTIFILLIYEYQIIFPLNKFIDNKESKIKAKNNIKRSVTFKSKDINKENISFFSSNLSPEQKEHLKREKSKDEIEKINNLLNSEFSLEDEENSGQTLDIKENYLFDELFYSKNYSFYCIKGFFICLSDTLDKKGKVKFIKNKKENYGTFKGYISRFDQFKKKLFSQVLDLIESIENEKILEKSLKLIIIFINDCGLNYIEDLSDKSSKSLFLHLFESKSILNKFFSFCLYNEIIAKNVFRNYFINSLKYINNNVLLYHPKPYIFSFIKNLIKFQRDETFIIIDNTCNTLVELLKSKDSKPNNFIIQNLFRLIKTLLRSFYIYSNNIIYLLKKINLDLFYCVQNFIIEITQNDIFYEPYLYVNNSTLSFQTKEGKKDINIFQLSNTKLLNNQVIFLNLFELALNSLYLLWHSQKQENNVIDIFKEYISKIQQNMLLNGNFIGYYLDLSNPFFIIKDKYLAKKIPEQIDKIVKKEFSYDSKNKNKQILRETKIISFSLFLLLMKYQSLFIHYDRINKNNTKNDEEFIRKAFKPFIDISEKEIKFLIPNVVKNIDNKNLENMIEKEENKNKEFKDFNKNYYLFYYEKIKNKNCDIKSLKEEIEYKFLTDENSRIASSVNININNNESKTEKEKNRKESFCDYGDDEDILYEVNKKQINNSNKEDTKNEKGYKINSLDFEEAKYPILCTKRDLILKDFGYFYYKYYFKNEKFMKLKKLFFYLNNPNDSSNNYHGFQKSMKNKYPFTIKNFSNNELYYPKVFFKPYTKFFENEFFPLTHSYFLNKKFDKINKEKILHLENGHGLLNQSNFDLYNLSHGNINNDIINESKEKFDDNNSEMFFEKIENNKTPFTDGTFVKEKFFQKKQNKSISSKLDDIKETTKFECEKISYKNCSNGFLFLGKNFLIFQVNKDFDKIEYKTNPTYLLINSEYDLIQEEKQIIIPYKLISQILYRKFLFFDVAIEIFLQSGKSYYFNFYTINNKTEFMKGIKEKINEELIISNSIEFFEKKKYTNKWLEGSITTLDYLLLINKYSDRSYNVLSHYLILPWLLNKYEDIYNQENIRNFNIPVTINSKKDLDCIITEGEIEGGIRSHFSNFCSASLYINHYLFRSYPYLDNQIRLQDNHLDDPQRQFNSLAKTLEIFKENPKINFESIPELYFIPEIFFNLNYCNFGFILQKKNNYLVNNLAIQPGFQNIVELINFHQSYLNTENIINNINKWIDFIFGENQTSLKDDSINFFPIECYEKNVKENIEEEFYEIKSFDLLKRKKGKKKELKQNLISEIKKTKKEIRNILNKSNYYGHCPSQIFIKAHPPFNKKVESKIYNFSNKNNYHIILKNDKIKINKNVIYYMQESSKGNYFYIVCEHEILVYNKNLKLNNHLSINNISSIPKTFSVKYHKKDDSLKEIYNYKFLIFDILDCKYFFLSGSMDNSLRVYSKEKEKDIINYIYIESRIRCIKNCPNSKIFFTGDENGKIIRWNYKINNNKIDIIREKSIRGHKKSIKMIEINEKYECFISVDINEIIFIRKLFDFELLSFIEINKYNKKVIDINIHNQIIILTILKIKTNIIEMYTYSLNGIILGRITEPLQLPISILPNNDEIIIFRNSYIYLSKIAFNEKTSLIAITNNSAIPNIEVTSKEDDDIAFNLNEDLNKTEAISYFYDYKNTVLFCLFSNGILYRINLIRNI